MTGEQPSDRQLLYYELTLCCPFCPGRPFKCRLVAEVEPPADAVFRPRCPNDAMPLAARFSMFKPCEAFDPEPWDLHYPPRPKPPTTPFPAEPPAKWWQFWKW
jgi:hypothetical protein